jgi:crotonobetainyl-CoA:carnitine CoA-transferase CaiB-like acyl-CoA transferase
MKAMFLSNRSGAATAAVERHAPVFNDPGVMARKALERWENEGGRIPGLATGAEIDRFARRNGRRRW